MKSSEDNQDGVDGKPNKKSAMKSFIPFKVKHHMNKKRGNQS